MVGKNYSENVHTKKGRANTQNAKQHEQTIKSKPLQTATNYKKSDKTIKNNKNVKIHGKNDFKQRTLGDPLKNIF